MKEKGFKLYAPPVSLSIIYFFNFGVASLYMILNSKEFWVYSFYTIPILDKGLNFIVLVFVFFLLGYYLPLHNTHLRSLKDKIVSKIPNVNNYMLQINNLAIILILFTVVGWICRVILVLNGGYYHFEAGQNIKQNESIKNIGQVIGNLGTLPLVGLAILFSTWLQSNQRKLLIISIVLFIAEIAYSLPSGSKERVLYPVALLLSLYSLKKKMPLIPLVIASGFFIFFMFPFIGIYRGIVLHGNLAEDMGLVFNIYLELFKDFTYNFSNILFSMFGDRLNYTTVVMTIVHNTPQVWNYMWGYSYATFFISLIPRLLWPGKPVIATFGNEFGRDYGIISPVDYHTSVAMSWVGEMFINFGWYGILVGFLYGFFYQTVFSYFMKSGKITNLSALLYVFFLYYMLRGDLFAAQFSGLLKLFFVILIVFSPFIKKVKSN